MKRTPTNFCERPARSGSPTRMLFLTWPWLPRTVGWRTLPTTTFRELLVLNGGGEWAGLVCGLVRAVCKRLRWSRLFPLEEWE